MAKQGQILLIADQAMRRSAAFETARRLAQRTGATLHIFLPVWSRAIAAGGLLLRRQGRRARLGRERELGRLLELEADALRREGLAVETRLVWSARAAEEALRWIDTLKPDLVVKDAEQETAGAFLFGADRRLLHTCPAPLLLVHRDSAATTPLCVAAAIDPDRGWPADLEFSTRIAATAADLAALWGAELHLIHVNPGLKPTEAASRHGHYRSMREREASPLVDGLANTARRLGVPAGRCHRLPGPVPEALSEFAASRGIDLLVVGVEPRAAWKRLLLGNRTERVNHYASCDILALKPEQAAAAREGLRFVPPAGAVPQG
jgi:universal stress protein E